MISFQSFPGFKKIKFVREAERDVTEIGSWQKWTEGVVACGAESETNCETKAGRGGHEIAPVARVVSYILKPSFSKTLFFGAINIKAPKTVL